jgi:hypothetical protein
VNYTIVRGLNKKILSKTQISPVGYSTSKFYRRRSKISGHRFLLRLLLQAQCKNRSNPTRKLTVCLDAQNSKISDVQRLRFLNFVRPVGFEPTTVSLRGSYSTN